jgi:hypothetical protein
MRRIDVVVIEVRHRDLFLRRCAQLSSSEFGPDPEAAVDGKGVRLLG